MCLRRDDHASGGVLPIVVRLTECDRGTHRGGLGPLVLSSCEGGKNYYIDGDVLLYAAHTLQKTTNIVHKYRITLIVEE